MEKIFNKPILVAHRGFFDKKIPENSNLSFNKASEKNLPIELDVHLTKDNKIVVFHDHNLLRMCGKNIKIENLTSADLDKLHLKGTKEKIPYLEDVLANYDKDKLLIIELKLNKTNTTNLCVELSKLLSLYPQKNIIIIGFSKKGLAIMQNSGYKVGLSTFTPNPKTKDFQPDYLVCYYRLAKFIKKEKYESGVILWTFNNKNSLAKYQQMGDIMLVNVSKI